MQSIRKSAPLIEILGIVQVTATSDEFIAREKFVVGLGCGHDCSLNNCNLSDDFTHWFLPYSTGKVEIVIGGHTLHYGKLRKISVDNSVLRALGGETNAETSLSAVYDLLLKQRGENRTGSEKGVLSIEASNIFYVRDYHKVLRVVNVHWMGNRHSDNWRHNGRWGICTFPLRHQPVRYQRYSRYWWKGWNDGCQVFSFNPLTPEARRATLAK